MPETTHNYERALVEAAEAISTARAEAQRAYEAQFGYCKQGFGVPGPGRADALCKAAEAAEAAAEHFGLAVVDGAAPDEQVWAALTGASSAAWAALGKLGYASDRAGAAIHDALEAARGAVDLLGLYDPTYYYEAP